MIKVVQDLWVSWKSAKWMPNFSCGRKRSYMNAYTVKPCDVLNAQNAVVKLVRRVMEYSKYGLVVLCVASCVRRVNVWDYLYLQVRDLCTFRIGKLLVAQPVLYYCCHKSQLYPVELLHMQGPPYVWQLHNSLQHFNSVQVCTLTPTFRRRMLVLHVSVLAVSLWIYILSVFYLANIVRHFLPYVWAVSSSNNLNASHLPSAGCS